MKLLFKIILGAIQLFSIICVLTIGIMFLHCTGNELDGSFQFWFVTSIVMVNAMGLLIHFLNLIGFTKEK